MKKTSLAICYLGYNDPRLHIRGTENVIKVQSCSTESKSYYFFRSKKIECFKWGRLLAIGLPWSYVSLFFVLNSILTRINKRNEHLIVHAHSYILASCATTGTLVFTVHDSLTYQKKQLGVRLLFPFKFMEIYVYFRAKKIHSISRYTWCQALFHNLFKNKVMFIYNTIANNPITTPKIDSNPYFLVVRSIEERANIELIIDYAEYLQKNNHTETIMIAGKGPLLEFYKKTVSRRKIFNINFLGYVSDPILNGLYNSAKCVIMPAIYGEGFGLPLIEAYSRGIPAVGSRVCAVPEVIYDEQHMFDNSIQSLSIAIRVAITVTPEEFKSYFIKRFDETVIKPQYTKFYSAVL